MEVTDLSVSRAKLSDKCMLAFKYARIDHIPEPSEGARKLFGNVVHNGVQNWYDSDFSKTKLSDFIAAQWWEILPQDVATSLRKVLRAERDLVDLDQLIQITRPTIKAPRQTKAFMESDEQKRWLDAKDGLDAASNECKTIRWPKAENAFQAYMKSMVIANQLQDRWAHRPRPIGVELEFSIEFGGITWRGRIDQVRADPDPEGVVKVEGLDIKTGMQPMTQMDAFLQAFIYNEACIVLPELPTPDYWTFWLARHNRPQHAIIERERHTQLALRILNSVRNRLEAEEYPPSYGMWCGSCDFASLCEAEISIWEPGTDGMALKTEVLAA